MLVSMFLDKIEEEYENTGDVPSNWWSDDEARYLLRNYQERHQFTKDERDFASSEAITKFELTYQPQLFFVPYIVGDIVENVLDLVIGSDLPTEFDAEQYDLNTTPHAALGGSTPLQILKDEPESQHLGPAHAHYLQPSEGPQHMGALHPIYLQPD